MRSGPAKTFLSRVTDENKRWEGQGTTHAWLHA